MADQRTVADWSYHVSQTVASYTLTGLIAFLFVKKLGLSEKMMRVRARDFASFLGSLLWSLILLASFYLAIFEIESIWLGQTLFWSVMAVTAIGIWYSFGAQMRGEIRATYFPWSVRHRDDAK